MKFVSTLKRKLENNWFLGPIFYKFTQPEKFCILKKTFALKDTHKGERCFIIANGPSINKQDLTLLKNEYTFTVNQFARREDSSIVKSKFHFWADRSFFDLDLSKAEDIELLNVVKKIKEDSPNVKCFFPLYLKEKLSKYSLDKELDCYLLPPDCFFQNFLAKKRKETFKHKHILYGDTVVHFCILTAIYMGFSEIYLLGCDNTFIVSYIQSMFGDENSNFGYGYKISKNEQIRLKKQNTNRTFEQHLRSTLKTFEEYRAINDFCNDCNIKLINCSAETTIESIPKLDYNSITFKGI